MNDAAAGTISLREVIASDLPIFYEHQCDPEAAWMADFPSRDRSAFTYHWMNILADPANILRTILFDGQVAGNIVCFEQGRVRQVGYWLGRDYWGHHVATRALAAFLDEVNERPLYAYVAKHNLASQRVLEHCGFTRFEEQEKEIVLILA